MSKKKTTTVVDTPALPAKARGGSDTIRARGLVQLAFALTDEERWWIHQAALAARLPANAWLRKIAVEAATAALAK